MRELRTTLDSSEDDEVIIDCAAYVNGERVDVDPAVELGKWSPCPESADGVSNPTTENAGFLWLGLRQPDEHELVEICSALEFDEVTPAEVLAPHARPVLTLDGPTIQLVLRTARYDDQNETVVLGEMTLLVGPRAIVSIRHGLASQLARVRKGLERDADHLRLGPMAILAAVVGRVIDDYGPALDGFENDVIQVETDVFTSTNRQPVERLYRLKREVRGLLVAIDALQDPLNRLIKALGRSMPHEVVADLNEAADQLDRAVTRAHSLSGLLDAALTASLTQITVQQNDDMRRISAWVAMAVVPTMIAGIYGMNFDTMPELGWTLGYPISLGVMAIIVAVMYRTFKRSGWL